ncbi:MAG: hypothetical protein ABIT10_03330 [Alteraurantiacibacter sp.]
MTVTDTYFCKNLEEFHPNIISTASLAEADLARAIMLACVRSQEPPSTYGNPGYLRDEDYPFMAELRDAVLAELC